MKIRLDVRILKGVAAALALVLAVMVVLLVVQQVDRQPGAPEASEPTSSGASAVVGPPDREITYFDGNAYAQKEGLETVLLMGVDKFAGETPEGYLNNQQADFLLLLVMDEENETCTPLQLNRDTMTQIQILGVTEEPAGSFTASWLWPTPTAAGKRTAVRTPCWRSPTFYTAWRSTTTFP